MKRTLSLALLLGLAAAPAVTARDVAGVALPNTVSVDGKTLELNGAGLRTKMVFRVYVAGLYLETPSKDAATVISSDQVKRMHLSILRSLDRSKITEAISEGFEKNSKGELPGLKARLDRLNSMIPNVEKGDQIHLTYVPGRGTVVSAKNVDKGVIEGKDFADALFSVWLGTNPVQPDLKKGLLGG
ncbi:MAG TPA: chalcone isomerase family protein [Thermoanaerobaculia bacterium]|nr:chalcone isomerase family protein [Thermoanaerobaculia bacterium]